MWTVLESKTAIKQIEGVPEETKRKYLLWRAIIQMDGPSGLRRIPGFKDHPLKGEWGGARSSRLKHQWRVIYFKHDKKLEVLALEVNPNDYRKKS
jgi:addiction module RelE/StbE family toxin